MTFYKCDRCGEEKTQSELTTIQTFRHQLSNPAQDSRSVKSPTEVIGEFCERCLNEIKHTAATRPAEYATPNVFPCIGPI